MKLKPYGLLIIFLWLAILLTDMFFYGIDVRTFVFFLAVAVIASYQLEVH